MATDNSGQLRVSFHSIYTYVSKKKIHSEKLQKKKQERVAFNCLS